METDEVIVVPDLRAKITGKPAPPRVELSTKPKQPKPVFASKDVRFKNQSKMLLNVKALTAKAVERKENFPNKHRWTGPGPASTSKHKSVQSRLHPKTGARKASADHSPVRELSQKRERSESRSPPRRKRSRPPTAARSPSPAPAPSPRRRRSPSRSPAPSPRRRGNTRSTKGKDNRMSWSRSPSLRHSRKKERSQDKQSHRSVPG
jgi:serine/arginine repetitive matrix protein 1